MKKTTRISLVVISLIAFLTISKLSIAMDIDKDNSLISMPLFDNNYEFDYGTFKANVSFESKKVTWSAQGYTETNDAKIRDLGNNTFFVNWVEKDKTFVTLFIDLNNMKVYSSVLSRVNEKEDVWFMEGSIDKQ